MNIIEATSYCFERQKARLFSAIEKYEESEFTAEIYRLIRMAEFSSLNFSEHGWDDETFRGEENEEQFLLRAAIWFYLGTLVHERSEFIEALDFLMKSNFFLGAMGALHSQRRNNAIKANRENNELKHQAIEYWRENIDKNMSNEAAARLLAKQVPLSTRKLAGHVAAAKKESLFVSQLHNELKNIPQPNRDSMIDKLRILNLALTSKVNLKKVPPT